MGDQGHALIVRLRPGHMVRGYLSSRRIDDGSTPFNGSPIFPPLIWKGHNHHPWQAEWTPTGPWMELPNIRNVKWQRSFNVQTGGQQGTTNCTAVMDNIAYPDEEGVAGLYHTIARGHFSPGRGVAVPTRPNIWPQDADDPWKDVLNSGYQIEVWEGYGEGEDIVLLTDLDPVTNSYAPSSGAIKRTYTGIVLDCDSESNPDVITVTSQDFGIFLTDQRAIGDNKAPETYSPLTFADRRRTQGEEKLTAPLTFSSGGVSEDGVWISGPDGSASDVEWVEVTLKKGFYTDSYVAPEFDGMEMFISLHLDGEGTLDHAHPLGPGWVTLTGPGTGTTPDGTPYMRHAGSVAKSPTRRWGLGHGFDVPDGSRLRFTFTNLARHNGAYVAGTHQVAAYQYGTDPLHPPNGATGVQARGWILVEDAAQVVRMVLIWAGFKEWHVEEFGWTLYHPMMYGADKFFMDIISDMLQQGAFIFYIGSPTNDDRSIGVPHFEHIHAIDRARPGMLEVRDTDMIESFEPVWDLSNLPHVIRYRGAISRHGQVLLGVGPGGLVRRFMATYYPPWAGVGRYVHLGPNQFASHSVRRTAGILRHFTETLGLTTFTALQSNDECLLACVLAAIQYVLNMATGQFQIPGVDGIDLNSQVSVVEESTATNSRVWVNSVQSEHEMGGADAPGYWHMTVGGSLVDTEDMIALTDDYKHAWALAQRQKASF